MSLDTTTCRSIAPEDVRVGDFITQMQTVEELPSFFWDDASLQSSEQPVRYIRTSQQSGIPARVRSICLPFVFVELATGSFRTWDLRLCRIAQMSCSHARLVWKELKPVRSRRKKRLKNRH